MTATKNTPTDKTAPSTGPKESVAAVAKGKPGGAQPSPGGGQPAPVAKKAIGVKEVPPFEWKLIGTANRYTLTLFKSVEREDSEAQLIRVRKDGYYKDLRVVDIDMKIVQPKRPRPAKKPAAAKKPKAAKVVKAAAKKKTGPTILKKATGRKAKTAKSASSRPAKAAARQSGKTRTKKVKKTKTAVKKKTARTAKAGKKTPRKKK